MNLEITDINQIPLVLARIENQGTLVPTKRFVEMAEDALAKMQAADIIQPDVLQIIERHTGFLIVGIAKTQVCVYFMTHEGLFLLDGIMIPV